MTTQMQPQRRGHQYGPHLTARNRRMRTNYLRPVSSSINGLGMTTAQTLVTAGSQFGQAAVSGAASGNMTQQIVLSAPSIAGSVATGAVGTAAWAGMAVPIIGAAVAGVTMLLMNMFKRGAQKEAATKVVNELEPQLKINLDGYLNGPRNVSSQAQALANFDAMWNMVVEACSNPQLGAAGQRCISERQRGGSAPWCPTGTGCDWFILYRDPIANDTQVKPDPVLDAGGNLIDSITGQTFNAGGISIPTPLLLAGAALALALFV